MTDAQYLAWLKSSGAIRCILVEALVSVNGVETTRYLSSANFVSRPTDTPPHQAYLSIVAGGVTISERMSIDGSASLTWGDIELGNEDGSRDNWLNDVWKNRPIAIYSGDARWPRSDFRLIFLGTIADFQSRERGVLNISLGDKLQRLNTPMTENRLGGLTENKDRLRPLCFGECHNIEPLLLNPATLTYQVHDGPIERIIEVRDNGVPVNFTADLNAGTFKLATQPAGLITVSVQGDKTGGVWRYTVSSLITHIVTTYGKPVDRFSAADLDMGSFTPFESAHQQPIGLYLPERTNILQACSDLASSLGAQILMSPEGRLRIVKIQLPALGTPTPVGMSEMVERTLQVADRPAVAASVKIGYCKNWTVQTNLQSGIPEQHKNLFALEWLTTTATNQTTAAKYRLAIEPVQKDTLLLREAEAIAEAARELALWQTQRTVYTYSATPALMLEPLGGAQILSNPRFGLGVGVPGQIVSISRDWLACRTKFEVLT
ncbi:MAG: hypothetical protein JWQ22_1278 [Devosia sp.]|nr:hypothetical protein [Devosia sp.]